MLELDAQNARLDRVEPPVVALDVVIILLRLAVIPEHTNLTRERLVVRGHGASFAAGAQVLARIEAERGRAAERASLAPPIFLFREVFCTVRLAGVFDDNEVVSGGQLEDGVHVGHLPVQMHGNECRHRAARALAHRAARLQVARAFGLEVGAQSLRVHGVGALVDVDEVRARAGLRNSFRRGDEGVRHGHDGIARLYAGSDQSKAQRVGATSYADATRYPAKLGKLPLEGLHDRSTDEARSLQS